MNNLSLPQILRHLLIGFIWMVVYYICFQTNAIDIYSTYKIAKIPDSVLATGIPILALVIGTLTFSIYRSLIYGPIILWITDKKPENVRRFLKKRYEISGWYKADSLWKVIREKLLREESKNIDLGSAGVHLLYMSALVVFVHLVFLSWYKGIVFEFWLLLGLTFIFAIPAILSDLHMQTIEYLLLKSIETVKLDKLVATIGFKKTNKNFVVRLAQRTALAPLNTETPQGAVLKSFYSKQEAIKFADKNKKIYNKIIIKCPNEDDIIYE